MNPFVYSSFSRTYPYNEMLECASDLNSDTLWVKQRSVDRKELVNQQLLAGQDVPNL
jgi:hypothetical protein